MRLIFLIPLLGMLWLSNSCQKASQTRAAASGSIQKKVMLDASKKFQTMDGFGVNINPDQWRNGQLKPVIDMLVDDLGATAIRFDCFGNGMWLKPSKMRPDGTWPEDYLAAVYRGKVFSDAWNTFRYMNSKGLKPFFNVSGIVPDEWNYTGTKELRNYDAYSEMQATLVQWAREKENLEFEYYAPFNETDLGGLVEGPGISDQNVIPAFRAIIKKFQQHGLDDLKFIVLGDANFRPARIQHFLSTTEFLPFIYAISGHTYGNGDEGDGDSWIDSPGSIGQTITPIRNSAYHDVQIWLTEYGDLDQTGEIEWEFAWRSQRRLLRALWEGVSLGLQWDAWDNYHLHDEAWSQYGLLKTDTTTWEYTKKPRYFAAKHIYKYVRPGWIRVEIGVPEKDRPNHVYQWHTGHIKNIKMLAFISPEGKDFTITGMSLIESDVELNIYLEGVTPRAKVVHNYRTTRNENFVLTETTQISNNKLKTLIKEKSIFTITTID